MAITLIIPGSVLGFVHALVQWLFLSATFWQATQAYFLTAFAVPVVYVLLKTLRRVFTPSSAKAELAS
jgi:hypothetical protein